MTTGKNAATLLLENEAMQRARIEDHRTCEALRRSLVETQDKLRAEVDSTTWLRTRLAAANGDVARLSAMVEELRDRQASHGVTPGESTYCIFCGVASTYCIFCGVAWAAHRDEDCEKRKTQDRARTVVP